MVKNQSKKISGFSVFKGLAYICILGMAFIASSQVMAHEEGTTTPCDYPAYLADPAAQSEYQSMVAEHQLIARLRAVRLEESAYARPDLLQRRGIIFDKVSLECLGCHDGNGGRIAEHGKFDPTDVKALNMAKVAAKHPIGIDYAALSLTRESLRKVNELPPNMTLVDGRISCITCHDPLNPKAHNLAVSEATLCFSCHNI
jgi:predicted CXXCH cytochrome family protein